MQVNKYASKILRTNQLSLSRMTVAYVVHFVLLLQVLWGLHGFLRKAECKIIINSYY